MVSRSTFQWIRPVATGSMVRILGAILVGLLLAHEIHAAPGTSGVSTILVQASEQITFAVAGSEDAVGFETLKLPAFGDDCRGESEELSRFRTVTETRVQLRREDSPFTEELNPQLVTWDQFTDSAGHVLLVLRSSLQLFRI